MIRVVPAYTLEMLDKCDIERLLPYYCFNYRKALQVKDNENCEDSGEGLVYRNGKAYKKVNASSAKWADDIF